MATLSLTILKAKVLKDGRHKIRIAVRHHHETCYIITPYIIDNISEFKNGQVVKRADSNIINVQLRKLLNAYQSILDDVKGVDTISATDIRNILINKKDKENGSPTFQKVCNDYIEELKSEGRGNYAKLLERNCRYFTEFCKGYMVLDAITPQMIERYSHYLKTKKNIGPTTLGMHMSRTRTIINRAKKMQLVSYTADPYLYYSIPQPLSRDLDISVDKIRELIALETKEKRFKVAKSLWLLSYYLGGINLVDLLKIDFSNKKEIEYVRTKSRNTKSGEKRISISIPDEAKDIIKRYTDEKGHLNFGYNFSYDNFSRYNERNTIELGKMIGVQRLCFYSARKSFVQHGFELGIPLEVLEYTIGQTMKTNRPIYNYVRIMRKHADNAIRTILDNLKK